MAKRRLERTVPRGENGLPAENVASRSPQAASFAIFYKTKNLFLSDGENANGMKQFRAI